MNRYLFNRIAGRVLRCVLGVQREPVRQLTEDDRRAIDHLYAALASSVVVLGVAVVLFVLHGG